MSLWSIAISNIGSDKSFAVTIMSQIGLPEHGSITMTKEQL
jgi:hypothetical protein